MAALILEGLTLADLETLIRQAVKEELQQQAAPASASPDISYLTRRVTAELLRISLVTLSQWTDDGKINAYKIGRRVLFRADEVAQAAQAIVPLKYRRRSP